MDSFLRMHTTLLVLILCAALCASQNLCTHVSSPQGVYDLTPVIGEILKVNDGFLDYISSVCADALKCGNCAQAGYCQTNQFFNDCMGKFSDVKPFANGTLGVRIFYNGGDFGNTGQIHLKCNPQADTFMNIRGEEYYKIISAEIKYACPRSCDESDCNTCVSRPECYWCLDNNKCLSTNSPCKSWTKVPQYCCATKENCTSCASSTCGWCTAKSRCINGNDLNCGAIIRDPDLCDEKLSFN